LGERIAQVLPSDVAEGHILKDTLQANHKSEEATRKHHKAKARSVIKKECGRRPHSRFSETKRQIRASCSLCQVPWFLHWSWFLGSLGSGFFIAPGFLVSSLLLISGLLGFFFVSGFLVSLLLLVSWFLKCS
jgi:hypothetical protein